MDVPLNPKDFYYTNQPDKGFIGSDIFLKLTDYQWLKIYLKNRIISLCRFSYCQIVLTALILLTL